MSGVQFPSEIIHVGEDSKPLRRYVLGVADNPRMNAIEVSALTGPNLDSPRAAAFNLGDRDHNGRTITYLASRLRYGVVIGRVDSGIEYSLPNLTVQVPGYEEPGTPNFSVVVKNTGDSRLALRLLAEQLVEYVVTSVFHITRDDQKATETGEEDIQIAF